MTDQRQEPPQTPAERVIGRGLEEAEGIGKPLAERTRQRQRTIEAYLKSGAPPRWMERIGDIDRGIANEQRRLRRAYLRLSEVCGDDPAEFAARWRAKAESWSFGELNELIAVHNEWYPVERDLPMDFRTRDYVLINGRTYRREPLGPAWILQRFPATR